MQHQHSDIQIGFPATPSHSRQSPSEVVNKSTGAPSDQYLHHDEHVVINQLSCITAPIRSNSDSGESDSDEDPDERAHDSDNESDGTPNSSGLGGSIGTAPHTLYSQEEAGYFSEAMFGLQQRREGGDYFWSAYGSMV
ncbi:hypothetical protein CC80DRAFT_492689 [Byssothecium circinans]|uniref:Uncharacterized protein n=1 Tax=Byssothecium circinans TaxID=147558 RepID=A0A6A5TTH0_9PLEO|nr:hypothetical protein CC80DRAFT_492689 [Byssothecium circinans]